ncbi:alpha-ketoglutarate-dependent dioxygenase AlkB [Hyunsoonleella sp. SJ7]|uniref:Alpha-ketoglutarate-dependent dioxygenase AlkB n=1 Tax=Hyunsoonleella aquatilis TaxID=2762758 RepID=A0A923KI10_9FLAO|nr:alpha-ketoglutarate-dependent dioxygenase AlkB [Hyunsoonleella aquatilis]MBC3757704.1 alpha-ketoglutarate-dependent dioxygenase AlkB [Hyunsoonleella aquatilis]
MSHQNKSIGFNLPDAQICLYDQFFSKEESDRLYISLAENINWQQDQIKFFGKIYDVPRLTALYGDTRKTYKYSGILMQPHPWNEDLLFIKERIEKEVEAEFSTCLLNYYRTGSDGNSWHQDNEKELGRNPIIASVSLGETRPFQLRHIQRNDLKRVDIPLTHGSMLLMKDSTQHFWKHRIPKTKRDIGPRINLTFRIIKNE